MPVAGLPPAVEAALNTLMEHNIMTSWRMTGGKNYTQITMRFSMADMSGQPGEALHSSDVHYRRKPPSAVSRDAKRRQQWHNMNDSNKRDVNRNDVTKTQVQFNNRNIVTHSAMNSNPTGSGSAVDHRAELTSIE